MWPLIFTVVQVPNAMSCRNCSIQLIHDQIDSALYFPIVCIIAYDSLQLFDTVGWATGGASDL